MAKSIGLIKWACRALFFGITCLAAYVFLLATGYFFMLLGIPFVLGWLLVWVLLCIPFIRWRLVIRWVTSQAKLTWQYRPGTRE